MMIRLRRYADEMMAERAAAFLRDEGIPAVVVGHHIQGTIAVPNLRFAQVQLMVPSEAHRERAEELLEQFENEPIELDADWEQDATPELGGLDLSRFDLSCPSCGYDLSRLASEGACPECGQEYDFAALIIRRHGPEALEGCFEPIEGEEREQPVVARRGRRERCRTCGEDLSGMAVRGRCPGCGSLFDKEQR